MANATQVATDPLDTAPDNDTPLSENQAAADIENLLGDDLLVEADPAPKEEDKTKEPREPDPLGEDEEDDEQKTDDDADGSQSATAGKYVAANAKYKLPDGTEITVAELARNNLFHRDYSKKTEEVARERDVITKEKAEVAKVSQTLREEREFLIWFAEQNVPKAPAAPTNSADIDPMAWMKYQEAMVKYSGMVNAWQSFKNGQAQDEQRKTGETQQQAQQRAQKEVAALFEAIPILKDQKKAAAFFDAVEKGASEHYGLTQAEIADALKQDHRLGLILRDALAYRRAKQKAPEVQKELAQKPRLVRGSARATEGQQVRRSIEKTTQRLRETGSMSDGIAAIESLL